MSFDELDQAFKAYFDEMDRCVAGGCYWALLHLSVILPDICAALESEDGQGKPDKYKNWCKRYLADEAMSASDWYALRCALLHQGQTTPDEGRYRSVSLSSPATAVRLHKVIVPSEGNITLDMVRVAEDIRGSIARWRRDLESPAQANHLANLQRHLSTLAKEKPKTIPGISGLDIQVVSST